VVVNPRGLKKTGLVYPGEIPASWSARFGSITFNQVGREYPMGGMNEAGLVVECMGLTQAEYPMADRRPAVMELQWMQYLLDTCRSVDEVIGVDDRVRIQQQGQPLHFLICDRDGEAAVIEFISFRTIIHRLKRKDARALTNSSYADCLTYSRRFRGFGGQEKVQETIYSVDRFVQLAQAIRDRRPTPEKAFAWLDMVSAQPGDAGDSHTQWQIVYRPVQGKIHFRTFRRRSTRTLDLSKHDFSCSEGARVLDLDTLPEDPLQNDFKALTTDLNGSLVRRTFAIYREHKFVTDIPDIYLNALANYPASLRCE